MRLVKYEGRKPVTHKAKQWLPGLGDDQEFSVFSFGADLTVYTEKRKIIKVGRVRIPIGSWERA